MGLSPTGSEKKVLLQSTAERMDRPSLYTFFWPGTVQIVIVSPFCKG
jgi:hypothetical protein